MAAQAPQATSSGSGPHVGQRARPLEDTEQRQRPLSNRHKGVKKRPARASSSFSMTRPTAAMPVGADSSEVGQARTSPSTVSAEPASKRPRSQKWIANILASSTSTPTGRGTPETIVSDAIVHAIDRQIVARFPHLPRPPTVEFHSMLSHILQSGMTLAQGLRIAEEHRERGQIWP